MRLLYLDRGMKGWLIGSIFVLCVNLIVFIFRSHFNTYMVLGVILLTPVAWTLLYVLTRRFLKEAQKE
jgi:hypothetical protein